MTVRATTADTGRYALIMMRHPARVGPALHVHPRGPEAFVVLEGAYTFEREGDVIHAGPGDAVVIPAGMAHRYTSGPEGGRVLVVTPPGLEHYFWDVAQRLARGPVPVDEEFTIAAAHGQDFLDRASHWAAAGRA